MGERHALTENLETRAVDPVDPTDCLADDDDAVCRPAVGVPLGDEAGDLTDSHFGGSRGLAVDLDLRVGRISDARAIDIDAAEPANRADEAGAPDAVVARLQPRAADAVVAGRLAPLASERAAAERKRQQQQDLPAARAAPEAHGAVPPGRSGERASGSPPSDGDFPDSSSLNR